MGHRAHAVSAAVAIGIAVMVLQPVVIAARSKGKPAHPLPSGCVQEWQSELSAYAKRCHDFRLVGVTNDLRSLIGTEKAQSVNLFFKDFQGALDECAMDSCDSKQGQPFLSCVLQFGKKWQNCPGFSIGYFEGFEKGKIAVRGQLQWTGRMFMDNRLEIQINRERDIPCSQEPGYLCMSNRGKNVVEQTPDGAFTAVSRFIVPTVDGKPDTRHAMWWRVIIMPMRAECTHLTPGQMKKVFDADFQRWMDSHAKATRKTGGKAVTH